MQSIFDLGNQLVIALQGLGNWLILPMRVFTFLGTEQFFLVILPLLYWSVDQGLGLRVGVILLVSTGLNSALKLALHMPRPYWTNSQVQAYSSETSFGAPSDHAQTATAFWGMLSAGMKQRWAYIAAGILIFLIGISRLFLGVHFPHDVLLGWLIGGLILWLVLRFWRRVALWANGLSLGGQILAGFLASLGMIVLGLIPFLGLKLSHWQPPASWADFAGEAISLSGVLTTAGTLFGLFAGLAWMTRLGGFRATGPAWKRILRYLIGVLGVLIFYIGLDVLFGKIAPDAEALLPYLLRYIRYALVGAWVSLGAPWIFLRMNLAEKDH